MGKGKKKTMMEDESSQSDSSDSESHDSSSEEEEEGDEVVIIKEDGCEDMMSQKMMGASINTAVPKDSTKYSSVSINLLFPGSLAEFEHEPKMTSKILLEHIGQIFESKTENTRYLLCSVVLKRCINHFPVSIGLSLTGFKTAAQKTITDSGLLYDCVVPANSKTKPELEFVNFNEAATEGYFETYLDYHPENLAHDILFTRGTALVPISNPVYHYLIANDKKPKHKGRAGKRMEFQQFDENDTKEAIAQTKKKLETIIPSVTSSQIVVKLGRAHVELGPKSNHKKLKEDWLNQKELNSAMTPKYLEAMKTTPCGIELQFSLKLRPL